MLWVWWFLAAAMIAEAILTLVKIFRFRSFFLNELGAPVWGFTHWPRVALIAPFKGIDPDLRLNIDSWFALEYPNFKIFFVVDSEKDPAVGVLHQYPGVELMIAGKAGDSGQKIHNLRYAIERIPEEFDVFAFVDSDCRVNPDWLNSLVARLMRSPECVATGYRWYVNGSGFGSLLRAVWNSSVLTLLTEDAKNNFAWGGSTAMMRSTFERIRVFEFWKSSVSDDYGVTRAAHAGGAPIHFVPGALAFHHDTTTVTGFLEWAFRQLLITRVYNPRLWAFAFVYHCAWILWLLIGIAYPFYFIPLFVLIQCVQMMKAEIRLDCVQRVRTSGSSGIHYHYWALGPVIGFLNFLLLTATVFTRRIKWRGIEYVLEGPDKIKIQH